VKLILASLSVLVLNLPAWAQEKLHPVRPRRDGPVILNSERTALVLERSFQFRLTIGFPDDGRLDYLPETKTDFVVFWVRIQNVSRSPVQYDVAKFTGTTSDGKVYNAWLPEQAYDRIRAGVTSGSIGTKALRRMSLGRAGGDQLTEQQVREDVLRYSLGAGEIAGGGIKEGFVYFEKPSPKRYTFDVRLGDLWTQPLQFSTQKQK
jgi:hypothetical protein